MKKKYIFLYAVCVFAVCIPSYAQHSLPWFTNGNTNTNPVKNFLGTRDERQLMFRVNNQKSGLIDYSPLRANTSLGYQSLLMNMDGAGILNTAFGYLSLQSNTTGQYNTAAGAYSLQLNTNGFKNTAFGWNTLAMTTTGNQNTAFGASALGANKTALGNTAVGAQALWYHVTGDNNTAVGVNSLFNDKTGGFNAAIGGEALFANISGSRNTAVGEKAAYSNTGGSEIAALGYAALYNNLGNANVALGAYSLYANTTGYENTAMGYSALYNNLGNANVAGGAYSLYANTTGDENTAMGYSAMRINTTGFYNVALGGYALSNNMEGYYNTAIGHQALKSNRGTASFNTAVGSACMQLNVSGQYNTASGFLSLYSNTSGNNNTAIGHNALHFSYGNYNSAFGDSSLFDNSGGYKNTGLGALTAASTGLHNATAVGFGAMVDASNKVRIGNTGVTSIGGQVGWSTYSDSRVKSGVKENVPGLAFINLLRPVTYHYNISKENELLGIQSNSSRADNTDDVVKILFTGFIAQEVDEAAGKVNYTFSGIDKSGKIWGLRYAEFVVPLVKAVQELSGENEKLKNQVSQQQEINNNLQKQIDALKTMVSQVLPNNSIQPLPSAGAGNMPVLEQNISNPFSMSTVIGYYLPHNNGNTCINFYSSSGILMRSVKIDAAGYGSVTFKADDLPSGIYRYILVADGKIAGERQMILNK